VWEEEKEYPRRNGRWWQRESYTKSNKDRDGSWERERERPPRTEMEAERERLARTEMETEREREARTEMEGMERRRISRQLRQQERQGQRGREQMMDEGVELEELEELLGQAKDRCAHCMQHGLDNDEYLLFSCQQMDSQRVREEYRRYKEGIRQGRRMEKYSGCMECFLPQAWCNQWEQSEGEWGIYRRKVGEKCEFQDVVLSGFLIGLVRKQGAMEGLRGRMREEGYDGSSEEEVLKYLGRKQVCCWGNII
jgi:hypothetical protein